MSKDLIRDEIRARITRKVPVLTNARVQVSVDTKLPTETIMTHNMNEYRVDVSVGTYLKGTPDEEEKLKLRAASLIIRLLYGDVNKELYELRNLLWEHAQLPDDSPVYAQLYKLIDMTQE